MHKNKNRLDISIIGIGRIFRLYGFFILLMMLFRTFFVLYFDDKNVFISKTFDVFTAYYYGWLYDSMVLSYFIVPIFLLFLFVVLFNSTTLLNILQIFMRILFVIIGVFIPVILISDYGFYSYFQDHINILFFGVLEDDTTALVETIQKNYPLEILMFGFLVYVIALYFLARKFFIKIIKQKSRYRSSAVKVLLSLLGVFVLLMGGVRGGYGKFVLAPKYADFSDDAFINQIALNGVIALDKAIKIRLERNSIGFNMAKSMGYGDDIHQAFSDYLGIDTSPTPKENLLRLISRTTPLNESLNKSKPNVVVILMESFGASWNKYNSETFNFLAGLDQHLREDYYFENIISSDNGTIGSLLALATNIPNRPGARYLSESKYLQVPLDSSSHIPYKNKGYETNFIYGGKLGWRDIGKYFKYQKYHKLIGENLIRTELELNGSQGTEWGLYDEHFFNYIYKQLSESTKPQFFLGLSTSNHPPFETPKEYKPLALEVPLELNERISREKNLFIQRFKAFQYANAKLSEFIQKIKDSPLGKNTIIAVTGDHNFWGFMNYTRQETFLKYTVPFYLYVPKEIYAEEADLSKIGSHKDIMTTIYNISLSNTDYISFGEDLFQSEETFAINGSIYANESGVIYKDKDYTWDTIPLIKTQKSEVQNLILRKRYRSTLTIADFFLQEQLKKSRE